MKTCDPQARRISAAILVALGFLFGTVAGGAATSPGSRVHCYDHAEITSGQILLGDVAQVEGGDAQLVQRLLAVVLGRSPLPGKTREVDRAALLTRIRQSGIDPSQIELHMPADITVLRAAMTVEHREIEAAVRSFVEQQTRGAGGSLRIKEIRVNEAVVLPQGQLTIRVAGPKNADWVGLIPINVFLKVDEEPEKRVYATVSIERLTRVVVTRRPLGRYKSIDDEDVEVKFLDAAGLPADCITKLETVIGQRTRRPLDSGSVLTSDTVEFPPLVKSGDRVRIIAETSGLRISAFGQVKQKGAQGELIQVVNLDSNKVIHARVLDSQTVKIDF
jgi:flagellar basal body P-ring formation protein FlgA